MTRLINIFGVVAAFWIVNFQAVEDLGSRKTTQENKIAWAKDVKLDWGNFKAKPDKDSPYSAESSLQISYRMKISKLGNKTTVTFFVDCYFEVDESWVKEGKKSAELLSHEQIHFDIAEYYARQLRKEFNSNTFNLQNYETKSSAIFQEMFKRYSSFQAEYDAATNHGRKKDEQKVWGERIEKMISDTEDYAK